MFKYDMRTLTKVVTLFVEIDIFVYKFGWINRNLRLNDRHGHWEIVLDK